jgi:hypothetical protein
LACCLDFKAERVRVWGAGRQHQRVKTKNYIISLAIASMVLVLADASEHLYRAWIDGKALTILKPDDQDFERIQDESHENCEFAFNDALAFVAQGIIIFLTIKAKHNASPDSK